MKKSQKKDALKNIPCVYCRRKMARPNSPEALQNPGLCFSEDHYIPLSKGGSNEPENIKPSCARCNRLKSDTLPEIFDWFARIVLVNHPDAPEPILRAVMKQFIMTLAEMAARNKVNLRKASLVALLDLSEYMKGR